MIADETAAQQKSGYRRVLRHMANAEAGRVVPSDLPRQNPSPETATSLTIGAYAGPDVLKDILGFAPDAEARRQIAQAFAVYRACADPRVVYDFSSETEMRGDAYVLRITATPRRTP